MSKKINMSHIVTVTNRNLCVRPFLEQMERVCRKKPRAIILREKDLTKEEYYKLAKDVNEICENYKIPLIPHTFLEVARELNIARIHLPLSKLEEASKISKETLSFFQTIGVSTHSVEDALLAQKLGATYITAGHIYTTDCKKGLAPRGLTFLKDVCQAVEIPVYGIGGINLDEERTKAVKEAGAAGSCIMSAMMSV